MSLKPQTPADVVTYAVVSVWLLALVVGMIDRTYQMPPTLAQVTGIVVGATVGTYALRKGRHPPPPES